MPTSATPGSETLYLGIDVGGTNIKAGIVTEKGVPVAKASLPTYADRGIEHGLEVIYRTIETVLANAKLEVRQIHAIGLATPGTMDIPGGWLLEPPNLPGWWHVPIRDKVGRAPSEADCAPERRKCGRLRGILGRAARDAHVWSFGRWERASAAASSSTT